MGNFLARILAALSLLLAFCRFRLFTPLLFISELIVSALVFTFISLASARFFCLPLGTFSSLKVLALRKTGIALISFSASLALFFPLTLTLVRQVALDSSASFLLFLLLSLALFQLLQSISRLTQKIVRRALFLLFGPELFLYFFG